MNDIVYAPCEAGRNGSKGERTTLIQIRRCTDPTFRSTPVPEAAEFVVPFCNRPAHVQLSNMTSRACGKPWVSDLLSLSSTVGSKLQHGCTVTVRAHTAAALLPPIPQCLSPSVGNAALVTVSQHPNPCAQQKGSCQVPRPE